MIVELTKKFSFPFNILEIIQNPNRDWEAWFSNHQFYIKEIYITPYFLDTPYNDMNGVAVRLSKTDKTKITNFLIFLKKINIGSCVVFNNVFNTTFQLFKMGLIENIWLFDSIVIPDEEWIKAIRSISKDIVIKNTVIKLPTLNQIESGNFDKYDVIYIHDEIIHNHNKFLEIKGPRKFGVVVNFDDCSTNCKFKYNHYALLAKDNLEGNVFCKTKQYTPIELLLKRNNIPGILSEYIYYSDVIDIYKLQGRNSTSNFYTSVELLENLLLEKDILTKEYLYLKKNLTSMGLIAWRIMVRNCGGDCDESCNKCSDFLYEG
jgi:hypothetical protein